MGGGAETETGRYLQVSSLSARANAPKVPQSPTTSAPDEDQRSKWGSQRGHSTFNSQQHADPGHDHSYSWGELVKQQWPGQQLHQSDWLPNSLGLIITQSERWYQDKGLVAGTKLCGTPRAVREKLLAPPQAASLSSMMKPPRSLCLL